MVKGEKQSVSFKKSPRVIKVQNSKHRNQKKAPPSKKTTKSSGYLSINEQSLPELLQAVLQEDLQRIFQLLDSRPPAYICVRDRKDRTCLHYAAYLGHAIILESLLQRENSSEIIDAKDDTGKTPLFKTIETGAMTCAELLLQYKCNAALQDGNGISPLHVATLENQLWAIDLLLANHNKADVNVKDQLGFTPLHLAAGLSLVDATSGLVRGRADPNIRDNKGRTPLFAACVEKNIQIIEILLMAGADQHIKDDKGRTAHVPQHLRDVQQLNVTFEKPAVLSPLTEHLNELNSTGTLDGLYATIERKISQRRMSSSEYEKPAVAINIMLNKASPEINHDVNHEEISTDATYTALNRSKITSGESNPKLYATPFQTSPRTSSRPQSKSETNTPIFPYTQTQHNGTLKGEIGQQEETSTGHSCGQPTNHQVNINFFKNPSEEKTSKDSQQRDESLQKEKLSSLLPHDDDDDVDRYHFLCSKNRELLLKKIKHCEQIEQRMRNMYKKQEKENASTNTEMSFRQDVLEKNAVLQNEVNKLCKKNAQLNLQLTQCKQEIVFYKKPSNYHSSHCEMCDAPPISSPGRVDMDNSMERGNSRSWVSCKNSNTKQRLSRSFNDVETVEESDPYFQETLTKLLRENALIKRTYSEFESIFSENLKLLEESQREIERLNSDMDTLKKTNDELSIEFHKNQQEKEEWEQNFTTLGRNYRLLESELIEAEEQNRVLEETVKRKRNAEMHQNWPSATNHVEIPSRAVADDDIPYSDDDQKTKRSPPPKPPRPAFRKMIAKYKPQRPKQPSKKVSTGTRDSEERRKEHDENLKAVKVKKVFWKSKK